jgi:hypothetical protein
MLCVWWAAFCGTVDRPNTWPLAFGMTPDEVSTALGVPLVYHSGRPGSEIFVARYPANIPGAYASDTGVALQFRKGKLTGWKKDWYLHPPTHHW